MFALDVVRIGLGVLVLFLGASWLIRGSAGFARWLGIEPMVVGLTVVAYGAAAPELAVAIKAAMANSQPLALGTVLGSCAANLSLILGVAALINPPTVAGHIVKREVPVLLGSVVAIPIMLIDGRISRIEGIVLIACAVMLTGLTLALAARTGLANHQTATPAPPKAWRSLPLLLLSLAVVVVAANWFVDGAKHIGADAKLSERMLGLTIVALGTAMPELIATSLAALRGQSALAIGTVIGSNLLNVFLVLGVVAYLRPIAVTASIHPTDFIGLIAITLLAIFMLRGERKLTRLEGAVLILAYVAYIAATARW